MIVYEYDQLPFASVVVVPTNVPSSEIFTVEEGKLEMPDKATELDEIVCPSDGL